MFLIVLQKVHLPFMNIHSLMNGAKMALITGTLPHVNIKMKRKTMKTCAQTLWMKLSVCFNLFLLLHVDELTVFVIEFILQEGEFL